MERMQLLEDAIQSVKAYTKHPNGWRPGLVDIWIYDILIDMHESDYESVEWQEFIWRKTPDEVMQHILDTYYLFDDLEYGPEQLHEAIREYLITKEFIVHIDDVSDEEYQSNLEGRK